MEFPTDSSKYHVEIECNGGVGEYQPVKISSVNGVDTYENKFTIKNIEKDGVTCNIDFITINDSNKTNYMLSDVVQEEATQLTTTNNAGGSDISYRYSGKNPNNYIRFNNEMWRIIGLIPVCLTESCGTPTTKLVKIIRNDSIGGYSYDASSTSTASLKGAWGENTLYKLLNEFYYGRLDGTSNPTGQAYCYGHYNLTYNPVHDCNFEVTGISNKETDYYGRMVKEVYWNTGASDRASTVSAIYKTETATQTEFAHIGLMSASDYGYAGTDYSNEMNSSTVANNTTTNWLYKNESEWTSIQNSSYTYNVLYVNYAGYLNIHSPAFGYGARPVVYLESDVYVISGEGTKSSPYIIGM